MAVPSASRNVITKQQAAILWLSSKPEAWFKDTTIDDRDKTLISADPVSFVDYTKGSFLRKIHHMRSAEEGFKQTDWVVETDEQCRSLVYSAGAQAIGFDTAKTDAISWISMTINVNIQSPPGTGGDWGFLSTSPKNIRIFKGPPETCPFHTWDAMILRDCTSNTTTFHKIDEIASRKWDNLLVKMCEDYDHPWVVVAVKDSGARPAEVPCNIP